MLLYSAFKSIHLETGIYQSCLFTICHGKQANIGFPIIPWQTVARRAGLHKRLQSPGVINPGPSTLACHLHCDDKPVDPLDDSAGRCILKV
jgi:hypothetical protein